MLFPNKERGRGWDLPCSEPPRAQKISSASRNCKNQSLCVYGFVHRVLLQDLPRSRPLPSGPASGYILILTLLVISILLAVGFGISAISIKEVVLSSFLRDSERALAAASSGVECALYWDRSAPQNGMQYTIFATGTGFTTVPGLSRAVCDEGYTGVPPQQLLLAGWDVDTTTGTGTTAFSLDFADGTCVDVTVVKVGNESTTVIGDGYNTCTVALPRRTQREIAVFTNI